MKVPFFRPEIGEAEIEAVVSVLRSGWLTTGPQAAAFEKGFAEAVGARHAQAVCSATAALHLAVEALGLREGMGVLVPTHTFAATAEIVRYQNATPILVDCDPVTLQMDLEDAGRKLAQLRAGELPAELDRDMPVVGIIPVHVGGAMLDIDAVKAFAKTHGLWVVEDAAHAFPAARRAGPDAPWVRCGEDSSAVSCFSFYANKTMTTGEGGMATTADPELAGRMRTMALHGLSHDAWQRYSGGRSWDYRIVAPGFKYNLSDLQCAVGVHQLARAEAMRQGRERIAKLYLEAFADERWFELPTTSSDRIDAWHLFPLRLRLDRLSIDRNAFFDALREAGVGCSVHWRPLHLHPYYADQAYHWRPEQLPTASRVWERLISIPIFSGMSDGELEHVIGTIRGICERHEQA